jgi:hypothetical protein
MRGFEAKYGFWQLLKLTDKKDADGIGIRVDTKDTVVFFNKKFRLIQSGRQQEYILNEASIIPAFYDSVYLPSIAVEDSPIGRIYEDAKSGKQLVSFGAFLNIDKIFANNKWCNHIIIDDLSDGYLFSRDRKEFMGLEYDECKFASRYRIIRLEHSYEELVGKESGVSGRSKNKK